MVPLAGDDFLGTAKLMNQSQVLATLEVDGNIVSIKSTNMSIMMNKSQWVYTKYITLVIDCNRKSIGQDSCISSV